MTTTSDAPSLPPRDSLLPSPEPLRLLDDTGRRVPPPDGLRLPGTAELLEMYRRMVVGRRFDVQATALTKQGRLAVYPSARGQEACQVGAVMAVRDSDWVFPTYRESMALVARGLDPVQVLTLLRGDWHCGYDP
jgi:2-oxoisovalerate dehydrogenase E1 component alpha subunit